MKYLIWCDHCHKKTLHNEHMRCDECGRVDAISQLIDKGVRRAVDEYGEVLKRLADT